MNKLFIIIGMALMLIAFISAAAIFIIHVDINIEVAEPISPLTSNVTYTFTELHVNPPPVIVELIINNAANLSKDVNIIFNEISRTPQCSGNTYTPNMPFSQTLLPGNNLVTTSITCTGSCQTGGCKIKGVVTIQRI